MNPRNNAGGVVKKGYIDLAIDQSTSITGTTRRGPGHSQSRDFVNRNFVSQMPGILTWQEEDQSSPKKPPKKV